MSRLTSFFVVGLISAMASGCGSSPATADELKGHWVFKDSRLGNVPSELKHPNTVLVLNGDGRFSVTALPGPLNPSNMDEVDEKNGSGRWSVYKSDGHQLVSLQFDNNLPGESFEVEGSSQSRYLKSWIGDPDNAYWVELAKDK